MAVVTFFVEGEIVGKARPRVTSHGTYTPEKTVAAEQRVALACRSKMARDRIGDLKPPYSVTVWAHFEVPKSWAKAKKSDAYAGRLRPGKPDADNLAKLVLDALVSAQILTDDAAVWHLDVLKDFRSEDGGKPYLTVTIRSGEDATV